MENLHDNAEEIKNTLQDVLSRQRTQILNRLVGRKIRFQSPHCKTITGVLKDVQIHLYHNVEDSNEYWVHFYFKVVGQSRYIHVYQATYDIL